jgi:phosphatidylinositol 4-kinase type 2
VFFLLYPLGPLELTRRTRILVWDDEVEVAAEDSLQDICEPPRSPTFSVPTSRTKRSFSSAGDFPPPPTMRRTEGGPRPVPFVAKFQRVHPGTTGVTVLEHLERLDAVEASLKRLGADDSVIEEEEEEEDVAESQRKRTTPLPPTATVATTANDGARAPTSPRISTSQFPSLANSEVLPPVPENDSASLLSEGDEEDLVAMSKSTSHVEFSPRYSHGRWASNVENHIEPRGGALDWMNSVDGEPLKRTVIVEVSEARALL